MKPCLSIIISLVFLATIPTTPTPYDFTKGFNTTVTLRLNTPYNSEYSNKSSSLYNSFAGAVTDGLKIAYKNLRGLQGVFVAELVCHEKVAVKHTVVTNSVPIVKVIEARLILANVTSGYLKGKVTEANQACEDKHADHDDDHEDSTNWVYMIVFVCITALLLLAMVCIIIQAVPKKRKTLKNLLCSLNNFFVILNRMYHLMLIVCFFQ